MEQSCNVLEQSNASVGDSVSATYPDDFTITYSLSEQKSAMFIVDEAPGQIVLWKGWSLT